MNKIKSYSELSKFTTFEDRYNYLKIPGRVGIATFGSDRYVNQVFYTSPEWRSLRQKIILRDSACDLGIPGFEINDQPLIHHINPIELADLLDRTPDVFDPEFLITTTPQTHRGIHFSNDLGLRKGLIVRQKYDTNLW